MYYIKRIKGIIKFNTEKVESMTFMFDFCQELDYIDLSNFNTANVINMYGMFDQCIKLKEIKGIN